MVAFVGPAALVVLPFLNLPVAGYMARRAFNDDRTRRRTARAQEIKRLANRYIDEMSFVVQKDSRDAIRRVHRDIRDHYTERAALLERTLQEAIAAAEAARAQHELGSKPETTSLENNERSVRQLRSTADRLSNAAKFAS
jgi:hypothetical protein